MKHEKIHPTWLEMYQILKCYFNKINKIALPYIFEEIEFEKIKKETDNKRSIPKIINAFCNLHWLYGLMSPKEKIHIDTILNENNCFSLNETTIDKYLPTTEELEKNKGYTYLSNFKKFILPINFYGIGHYDNFREEVFFDFEPSLELGIEHIKKMSKRMSNDIINVYLMYTARTITCLPAEEFNKIDILARKHGILTIKEAFDTFPYFRKEFNEEKRRVENSDYLDWRGTGTYYPEKKKSKKSVDVWVPNVSFETLEIMHPINEDQKNVVTIQYTGSYSKDAEQAYKLSNIPPNDLYVWHYNGSYDPETNTGQVELVLKEAHALIEHATGVEDYEKLRGVSYTD